MRKLIAGLVGLVVLALLADLGAGAMTEHRVSRSYRAHAGLAADPSVAIGGFPFLRHAATGTYESMDIRADGIDAAPLAPARGGEVDPPNRVGTEATLRKVTLTPDALLSRTVDALAAKRVDGRLLYSQTSLGRATGIPDLQINPLPQRVVDAFGTAAYAEMTRYRRVLLSASFPDLGVDSPVTVEADTALRGDRLHITPVAFHRGPDGTSPTDLPPGLPAESQEAILRYLTMDLPVDAMPLGVTPTFVTPQNGRLLVEGSVRNALVPLTAD